MKGHGRVFRPRVRGRQTAVWWLDYSIRGERFRESSGTTSKRDAQHMVRQRLVERESGKLSGRPDRVTLRQVRQSLESHYQREGNRSLRRAQQALNHLERFLGQDRLVIDITQSVVNGYLEHRRKEEAAPATAGYEVRILGAALSAAVDEGLLAMRPTFKLPIIRNARQGFFEEADFAALLVELPDYVRNAVRFLRMTGWRKSEALGLTWDQVDWDGQIIRLYASQTKGSDARVFPFGLAPELKELLEYQRSIREGPFVFHRNGQRLKGFRRSWMRAARKAGLEGRILHDLRRTAARDFRRQGVSEGEIMKLCGWKTRAMFDRYNIIDEADLARAVAKRFNGQQTANMTTPTAPPSPLSSSAA